MKRTTYQGISARLLLSLWLGAMLPAWGRYWCCAPRPPTPQYATSIATKNPTALAHVAMGQSTLAIHGSIRAVWANSIRMVASHGLAQSGRDF
jgi:hypothetical protein